MAYDVEGKIIEKFLKRTLWLWLFPYIFWFLGRRLVVSVYDWLTEPHADEEDTSASRR
ncbi:MAG: hypothetical protein G01um1014106_346 [Parcubacteria group bacterium Gr01-1014_106]|nr:MAG: hypothetical protein G01um1014106_346 [Parcubacteria group bacterium Gr01-1014_106]